MRQRAEALDEVQRTFIANAAHELRTPLTLLKTELEEVAKAPDLARALLRLDEARHRVDTIEDLVAQLIGLAELDAALGQGGVPQELTRLDEAAFDAITRCRLRYPATPVELHFGRPGSEEHWSVEGASLPEPWVRGSRVLLAAAIKNLLGNAAKFSPAGARVRVNLWLQESNWQLSISDSGVGITPDELTRVFELFYRGRRSAGLASGSGVGLPLVRRIVTRLGGTVTLVSDPAVRPGTVATLSLPSV